MKGMRTLIKLLLIGGSFLTLGLMAISSVLINKPAVAKVIHRHYLTLTEYGILEHRVWGTWKKKGK